MSDPHYQVQTYKLLITTMMHTSLQLVLLLLSLFASSLRAQTQRACPKEFAVTFTEVDPSSPRLRSLGLDLSGTLEVKSYAKTDYVGRSSDGVGECALNIVLIYVCLILICIASHSLPLLVMQLAHGAGTL